MKTAKEYTISYPDDLPIVARRREIIEAIRNNQVLIIAGETGSGKTTQLAKMCLEAGRGRKGRIACTQPRRIAAISVAERVAEELGDEAGLVGYKIRFQDQSRRTTKIKFMTDGILLAEAHGDRLLSAYDTVIIDEAHERSLNIDFLLGLLKQLLARRPELKVLVTSATMDTEKFSRTFNNAPVIEVSGRCWPVQVRYQPLDPDKEEEGEQSYVDQAVAAVLALRREDASGDILVFMPTERDISETVDSLGAALAGRESPGIYPVILPLFGRLSPGEQKKIFQPVRGQKIVVATNVAETSITVPNIRAVVDTGLARLASYNVRARTSKLPIVRISRASCDQRLGRCGRVGAGICVRLFSEEDYASRPEYTTPEILRSNLAAVILRMTFLRLGDPAMFPFIDPPSSRAINDGYALLEELGGLDRQRSLTAKGRLMARLPLDPRISRMIIEARDNNALREVVVIASALSIQDPRLRPPEKKAEADAAHARFSTVPSDFYFFLELWDAYSAILASLKSLSRMRKFCRSHYLSFQRMREWRDIHEQISMILAEEPGFAMNSVPAPVAAVHRAILAGNLRNIAMKKEKNLYLGSGGREIMVFPGSGRFGKSGPWIMAAELVETSRLYARTVADIEPEWLEPLAGNLCRSSWSEPHWEKKRGQVAAYEKVTLFGLVIVARRRVNFGPIAPEEARAIFIQSALVQGELAGDYDFLLRNQALLEKLEGMEDRLRQRDIVVDEHTIAGFYDLRLGPEVRDQQSLNRWLKEAGAGETLVLGEQDLLLQLPEAASLEQFPALLRAGDFELALAYRFAPGQEDDGVSVQLPATVLPWLKPEFFEWLVPGLLVEKVTFLLKGLPKATRRLLVPVPQTALALVRDLPMYRGSLYRSLEQVLFDSFRVRVAAREWPIATLPPHLRFRYCLLDKQGQMLKSSRDFNALKELAGTGQTLGSPQLADLRSQWERKDITLAQLDGTPSRLPVSGRDGGVQGYVYPGLAPETGNRVDLRLFDREEEARQSTRRALLALYSAEFAKQMKAAKKELAIQRSQWALLEGIASHEQFNAALHDAVFFEIFRIGEGSLPSAMEFAARVEELRKSGILPRAREVFSSMVLLLQERRATLDCINRYAAMGGAGEGFDQYRHDVALIVPQDFLESLLLPRLPALCRYLKALRIRVERAHVSPGKDRDRAQEVAPHEARFVQAAGHRPFSVELQAHLRQYREMIEEFKVSLFAQELGTAFPVSAQRLEKKWREMEPFC